jgi:hypothetical protein
MVLVVAYCETAHHYGGHWPFGQCEDRKRCLHTGSGKFLRISGDYSIVIKMEAEESELTSKVRKFAEQRKHSSGCSDESVARCSLEI